MTHHLGGREPGLAHPNQRRTHDDDAAQAREFARRWKEEGRYTEARYFEYCFHHTERRLACPRPAAGHMPFRFDEDAA